MQRRRAMQARAEKKNRWREERSERHSAELVASLARKQTRQREREIRSHMRMDANTLEMEILEFEHLQTWNAMNPGGPRHTGIDTELLSHPRVQRWMLAVPPVRRLKLLQQRGAPASCC